MLIKNLRECKSFLKISQNRSLRTLSPLIYFSTKSSAETSQKDTESLNNAKPTEKPNESNSESNLYYPIRRINFGADSEYPIYVEDEKARKHMHSSMKLSPFFVGFAMYSATWALFLDLNNYWHIAPLCFLVIYGVRDYLLQRRILSLHATSASIHKDGKTLTLSFPVNIFTMTLISDPVRQNLKSGDEIKLQVSQADIKEIGFMQEIYTTEKAKTLNVDEFVMSPKAKRQRKEGNENDKEESKSDINTGNTEESTDEQPVIMARIEINGTLNSIFINLNRNKNAAYNDYLIALAKKKTLVIRETEN